MQLSHKQYSFQTEGIEEIKFNLLSAVSADNTFATIQKLDDNPDYIEYLFNFITSNKYDISQFPSGIPLLIIYGCIKLSGYFKSQLDLPNIIDLYRETSKKSLFYNIYKYIASVFPQYRLEELKALSTNELFELFVFAEDTCGKQFFDTNKMRKVFDEETRTISPKSKKGIASVTADELDLLKQILDNEEAKYQGLPH
jgi:hypothetical protein